MSAPSSKRQGVFQAHGHVVCPGKACKGTRWCSHIEEYIRGNHDAPLDGEPVYVPIFAEVSVPGVKDKQFFYVPVKLELDRNEIATGQLVLSHDPYRWVPLGYVTEHEGRLVLRDRVLDWLRALPDKECLSPIHDKRFDVFTEANKLFLFNRYNIARCSMCARCEIVGAAVGADHYEYEAERTYRSWTVPAHGLSRTTTAAPREPDWKTPPDHGGPYTAVVSKEDAAHAAWKRARVKARAEALERRAR
jgi:hypothetical protein